MTREEIELVGLAALAAGYTISLDRSHATAPVDVIAYGVDDYTYGIEWNPLVDDGDALRLSVKLELFHVLYMDATLFECEFNAADPDPYAATRRAIVQAAAHIGQQIKSSKEATNVNQV